jgi:hypothetical protein
MDKGRRQELKQLKYKKRLRLMGQLNAETLANPRGEITLWLKGYKPKYNFTAFKNHSHPCSCWCCSSQKYNRAKTKREIDTIVVDETKVYHDDYEKGHQIMVDRMFEL